MDWIGVLSILIPQAVVLGGAYLAHRKAMADARVQAQATTATATVDLTRIVDERTAAFITRLEAALAQKDEQIGRLERAAIQKDAQIDAIEAVANELRLMLYEAIAQVRRHDPIAADHLANKITGQ